MSGWVEKSNPGETETAEKLGIETGETLDIEEMVLSNQFDNRIQKRYKN
jgi:hypothetical protein